jgi:hypothetical protein
MNRICLRVFIAALTFIIGVSSAYLAWLAYRKPAELPPTNYQLEITEPFTKTAASPEVSNKSSQEEWEELAGLGGCTLGFRFYEPQFESYQPVEANTEAGIFYNKRWVAFFRRDKHSTVPFLISQISNKAQTNVHIDPFGAATKGELAVYCLQYILKVNWYELKKEYQTRFDKIDYEYTTDQDLLQKIIGTKRGAQEMMDLWQKVYEQSS